MPKLSRIESEATRRVRRMREASRCTQQETLISPCEAHWPAMCGPEPATLLARALWSSAPRCAEAGLG